jgi:hypothetical protein
MRKKKNKPMSRKFNVIIEKDEDGYYIGYFNFRGERPRISGKSSRRSAERRSEELVDPGQGTPPYEFEKINVDMPLPELENGDIVRRRTQACHG